MSGVWAVTGASGFIGRHLVRELEFRGTVVRPFHGRLSDHDAVRKFVEGADTVVHLAAYVHRRADTHDERERCRLTNVEGTEILVNALATCNPTAFLVFVSSANVYPSSDEPLSESAVPSPRTFYGETKLAGERIVLAAIKEGLFRGTILRPAMVFGRGAPGNLNRLMRSVRRKIVPIFGFKDPMKSIVPVEALIAAILAVTHNNDVANGEIFNVAGASLKMRRVIQVIAEAAGVKAIIFRVPAAPIRLAASVADGCLRLLHIAGPNLRQLIDTSMRSAVLSDEKLRRLARGSTVGEVEDALRRTVVDEGGFELPS